MSIKRVTAIVPIEILAELETHLRQCGVPGVTVGRVQGYGEHPNFFRRDLMKDNAKLVLFSDAGNVDEIVTAIARCAHLCDVRSGILAVEPVDRLVSLVDGSDVLASSLQS